MWEVSKGQHSSLEGRRKSAMAVRHTVRKRETIIWGNKDVGLETRSQPRFQHQTKAPKEADYLTWFPPKTEYCGESWYKLPNEGFAIVQNLELASNKRVVVTAKTHHQRWMGMIKRYTREKKWQAQSHTITSCSLVEDEGICTKLICLAHLCPKRPIKKTFRWPRLTPKKKKAFVTWEL